jgi:predicted CXXCH cytochrome family protein
MTMKRKKTNVTSSLILLVCIVTGIFIGACSMFEFEPVVMRPLSIPGAEYVGSESCAANDCHPEEAKYFKLTDHASVTIDITEDDAEEGVVEGCESCHGPGSLHLEFPRDKSLILQGSAEACFSCHLDIQGKFMLQHRHPVLEGRMSCADCHDMHGKDVRATGGAMLQGQDEKCFKCHKEMKGPFVFEHDAMREGCKACHNPHGSINDKLLVAGQSTTCIRCHWETSFNQGPNATLGAKHHDYGIGAGVECIDHHRAPHGSNIWRTFNR